jgi:hypothetical protein
LALEAEASWSAAISTIFAKRRPHEAMPASASPGSELGFGMQTGIHGSNSQQEVPEPT